MSTISIPVGTQPFLKTESRPLVGTAGEAIGVMDPIYKKSSDGKFYVGDSDPTDSETSVIVGLAISKAEVDSQVLYVSARGVVIDFGVALTKGDRFFLDGSTISDDYADVSTADKLVQLGYANEIGDFVVGITVQDEPKAA